jgi:hypothetical protein
MTSKFSKTGSACPKFSNSKGHEINAKEKTMQAIQSTLIQKLQRLPPQRLAEVEDFVEFLAMREERAAAGDQLGVSLAKLDALNLPLITDEEIEAEIQQARRERKARGG